VVAVVRAEEEIRVAGDAVAGERCLQMCDQVVDRLDGLRTLSEGRVDLRDLGRGQGRVVAEPRRLV